MPVLKTKKTFVALPTGWINYFARDDDTVYSEPCPGVLNILDLAGHVEFQFCAWDHETGIIVSAGTDPDYLTTRGPGQHAVLTIEDQL